MNGLILFFLGFTLLLAGAEMVVRGASRLATSLGITPLVLGLTVVAIGTSMPELAVGITASRQGSGALAVGNIAGTNVFNILFILGMSALLRPLPLHLRVLRLDLPVMIAAAAMMTVMALDGVLSRLDGVVFFCASVVYTVMLIRDSRGETSFVKDEFRDIYCPADVTGCSILHTRIRYSVVLAAGMGLTVLGADWLVKGAIDIARALSMSDAMIGLTIVAVGTSAPELATTVVATLRDERDVAVGNLIGSSIYNIFVILGLTCLASPGGLLVERTLLFVDIMLMAGVTLLCIPVFITGKSISRSEGGILVAIYVTYMFLLILFRT